MAPQPDQTKGSGSSFLWVNSSTSDPTLKAKERTKIHSHVRKLAAKQFVQTHKKSNQRQYHTLAARTESSKSRNLFCWNKNCPLSYYQTSSRPTDPGPSNRQENLLDSNGPAQAVNLIRRENNTSSSDNTSRPADIKDKAYGATQEKRCRGCGQWILAESSLATQRYGRRLAKLQPSKENLSLLSSIETIGGGKADPFSCYPVAKPKRYMHELLDHAVTLSIPPLFPDDAPPSTQGSIPSAWLSTAIKHPFLFHAFLFGNSVHQDFLHHSKFLPNSPRALTHKIIVIQHLNEIVADPKQACTDEVILAIMILASHEALGSTNGKSNPFNPPLKDTQWINVYGNLSYPPEHIKAVIELITLRGGVENLKLPGLAETIYNGDVVSATNSASKPIHPESKSAESWIATVKKWAISAPRPPVQKLAAGFRSLKYLGFSDAMLDVFDAVGAITLTLDYYLQRKLTEIRLGAIARTRNVVQHRLLSLPGVGEFEQSESDIEKLSVYECCRLTALIYGIGVIFPIPNNYPVFTDLVKNLKVELEELGIEVCEREAPHLLVWILVLGGVAALHKEEREWYVKRLAEHATTMGLLCWESVEEILEEFLWFDSACGDGGRVLWGEAMETREAIEKDQDRESGGSTSSI